MGSLLLLHQSEKLQLNFQPFNPPKHISKEYLFSPIPRLKRKLFQPAPCVALIPFPVLGSLLLDKLPFIPKKGLKLLQRAKIFRADLGFFPHPDSGTLLSAGGGGRIIENIQPFMTNPPRTFLMQPE